MIKIKEIIKNIKLFFVKKSKRMYVVEESAMESLIGMKCLSGEPKSGKVSIFSLSKRGYRSITPILVKKVKNKKIELYTKSDLITIKRIK